MRLPSWERITRHIDYVVLLPRCLQGVSWGLFIESLLDLSSAGGFHTAPSLPFVIQAVAASGGHPHSTRAGCGGRNQWIGRPLVGVRTDRCRMTDRVCQALRACFVGQRAQWWQRRKHIPTLEN